MTRAGSLLVAACVLVPARAATPQTLVRSFDGDSGPGLATCQAGVTHCDRPEMSAAASGKQVVQVTWQSVRVYDHDGRLLHSTPMADLIKKAGLDPKPPKQQGPFEALIVFDEFLERWIVTVTGRTDSLLVSASSDAGGAWGGVSLSCLQGGPCLDFDPGAHIGYDKKRRVRLRRTRCRRQPAQPARLRVRLLRAAGGGGPRGRRGQTADAPQPCPPHAGVLTALDPSDGTKLWTTHQYANDAAPCVWNTRIVEYEVGAAGKRR
jgi:hypothetical protein